MSQVSIAAGSQISAEAGAAVAAEGGNAVDAALAAAIVAMCTDLGVMAPGASGFIAVWSPDSDPVVIDAYAEMPGRGLASAQFGQGAREVFFDYGGRMSNIVGYGSVATPGIFAGLGMASERYGAIPWADVVAPAIRWTDQGFPLTGGAAEYLRYTHEAIFSWHPESYQALHHADGSPLQAGEIVHIPNLADSLRLIAQKGADVFYTGEIGQRMAAEIQANGGLLTAADLAAYQAIPRSPIRLRFGDWEMATNPPPAIGGPCLAAMLLLLDQQPFPDWNAATVERLVEIQQAVLDYRRRQLDGVHHCGAAAAQLLELAKLGNLKTLIHSPSTIHISAVDSEGLACSISASAGYGSGTMISGTGLWLNNSLGEIDLHPKGLEALPPGTRLASNMAPTIARRGDGAVLAIGSPGASRITTAIAQVLSNFVHLDMSLERAIAHPRLHVENFEGHPAVAFEVGLPIERLTGFITRDFPKRSMYFGGVQAALWDPIVGLSASADRRRAGGVAQS
ncbi:MAG: gamma-glutamyltransferase [Leptolyngbyaceae cyanobacterium MO_188.B28]|nr:gamma-glutamyltransferase [Leptolyngbyaceae cyanobacterium MO_188.B28]